MRTIDPAGGRSAGAGATLRSTRLARPTGSPCRQRWSPRCATTPPYCSRRRSATPRRGPRRGARHAAAARADPRDRRCAPTRPRTPSGCTLMQERFSFPEFTAERPQPTGAGQQLRHRVRGHLAHLHRRPRDGRDRPGRHKWRRPPRPCTGTRARRVALATASAYMDALLARALRRAGPPGARHHRAPRRTRRRTFFDAGMMVESDLLQARVQLAHMEENLIARRERRPALARRPVPGMGVEQDASTTCSTPTWSDRSGRHHARRGAGRCTCTPERRARGRPRRSPPHERRQPRPGRVLARGRRWSAATASTTTSSFGDQRRQLHADGGGALERPGTGAQTRARVGGARAQATTAAEQARRALNSRSSSRCARPGTQAGRRRAPASKSRPARWPRPKSALTILEDRFRAGRRPGHRPARCRNHRSTTRACASSTLASTLQRAMRTARLCHRSSARSRRSDMKPTSSRCTLASAR